MPIIARHNQKDEWQPRQAWPETCSVQWGGSGVVFSKKGNYKTAFFEAFPKDGSAGFIRGEGATPDDAEHKAFQTWRKNIQCHQDGGHHWTRARRLSNGEVKTYSNGGCFCLNCGAFETAMKPILKLGEWREPLNLYELKAMATGHARPRRKDHEKDARRLILRAKLFGIELPDWRKPEYQQSAKWPEPDPYEQACLEVVVRYFAKEYSRFMSGAGSGNLLDELFTGFTAEMFKQEAIKLGLLPE